MTKSDLLTGPEIRALRVKHYGTQRAMAEALGATVTTVSRWERGECKPTGAYRRLLAQAIG